MTKNDASKPTPPTPPDAKTQPAPNRSRQARAYRIWQLYTQGTPLDLISQQLKQEGYRGCSPRTVDRDLASIRVKRKIDQATHPELFKRDLATSAEEKNGLLKVMWEVINQPAPVDKDGNMLDRSYYKIQAARVANAISRGLDRLYGLDLVAIKAKLDEFERTLADIKQTLADRQGNSHSQGSAGSQPSSGSPAPGPS